MSEKITIDKVGAEGLEAFGNAVIAVLDDASKAVSRVYAPEVVHLQASGADGGFLGGLTGESLWGWFFIKYLAVVPEARSLGIGAKLVAEAEVFARAQGCVGVYVDTYDFQAPRFYVREDYEEVGHLPAAGDAPQRIWFAKKFD